MHNIRTKNQKKENMPLENKHHAYGLDIKSLQNDGFFVGYASVFDVLDSQKDVILRGAFHHTLKKRGNAIKLLWQHNMAEPIGTIETIREDERGLYVEGRLMLEVKRAEEAYALLKADALNGLSIGFTVKDYQYDPNSGVRLIKEIDLWEVSLVTFPCNTEATVRYVKGTEHKQYPAPQTVREFEQFLHAVGYSRRRAKQLALKGFMPEMDADETRMWETARRSGQLIEFADALDLAVRALTQ